ncbi:MAG: ABC transporter substrate-binding protein [Smithellaceae bacterium]|nr:ABC transporter substrate-binding protein [Smithellaceae bacterium]
MKIRVSLLYFFLFLVIPLGFSGTGLAQLKAGEPVLIGVPTFLGSIEGGESLKAVTMAVEEINARGGVTIKGSKHPLKVEASEIRDGAPGVPVPEALMGIEKIILDKKVHAIVVGPFRSEALLATMDILAKYKVPMLGTIAMTPASEKKVTDEPDKYKYVFRSSINAAYLVGYLNGTLGFLNKEFGFKKVFFMVQDVLWARGTAAGVEAWCKREGWEILGMETFPTGAGDFSSALLKAQSSGAQIIMPIFDMPTSGILVRQWNSMRVPALMAGFISPLAGPGAWKTFEGRIEGALNAIFEVGNIPVPKIPKSVQFHEAYKKRWGVELESGHGPAPSYDSVYLLAEAIEKAGSVDPDAIVAELQKTDRTGAIGRIKFSKGQQVIYGFDPKDAALGCVYQWRDGKRVIVYPEAVADSKIQLPPGLKSAK